MKNSYSAKVLATVDQIEANEPSTKALLLEVRQMGEALGEQNWDKDVEQIVEQRRVAREAAEDAAMILAAFDLKYNEDTGEALPRA